MTPALLLGMRLLLAAVFALSGAAKMADRAGTEGLARDFGIPLPLARLLPFAELLVAIALLPLVTAWWGAIGALALLGAFVVAIAYNIALGRTPECRCFGQLHSRPVGWPTLARNAALAAVAGFLVWQGRRDMGPSGAAWLHALTLAEGALLAGVIIALGGIALGGLFLSQLFAQHGRILTRLDALEQRLEQVGSGIVAPSTHGSNGAHAPRGLPIGAPAPAFELPNLAGQKVSLGTLLHPAKPVLLLFVDPACGPCQELVPEAGRCAREYADRITPVFISRGRAKDNRKKFAESGIRHVLLQDSEDVSGPYAAIGTPSAVVVRPDGRIGSAVALGADAIRALIAELPQWLESSGGQAGNGAASVGASAPRVSLPDLAGKTVSLASFQGRDTLVLFWNPGCSFCMQMLDDLKRWEERADTRAPQLVVISTGEREANRAMHLRSPVLLDDTFSVGQTFAVPGTPAAILVDAVGKIASPVAVGAQAVLSLATPLPIATD